MNVQPTLLTHAKFTLFKRNLAHPAALEFLLRLWAHCQTMQRGENWGKVSGDYVEAICLWEGEREKLFKALTEEFCGKPGWVRVTGKADVIICGWEEHNASLLKSWRVGKTGGRPRKDGLKPQGNPKVSSGKPQGNPKVSSSGTSDNPNGLDLNGMDLNGGDGGTDARAHHFPEAEWPSLTEVLAECRASQDSDRPVSEETGRAFWEHYEKTALPKWTDAGGKHFQWRGKLRTWAAKDAASPSKNGAGEKSREQLEAELAAEKDGEKRKAIKELLKKAGGT